MFLNYISFSESEQQRQEQSQDGETSFSGAHDSEDHFSQPLSQCETQPQVPVEEDVMLCPELSKSTSFGQPRSVSDPALHREVNLSESMHSRDALRLSHNDDNHNTFSSSSNYNSNNNHTDALRLAQTRIEPAGQASRSLVFV